MNKYASLIFLSLMALFLSNCASRPGKFAKRRGDEIVVAGHFVHTGTPVVLWMDPGGFDAYRVERRFSLFEKSDWPSSQVENTNLYSPNRYDLRAGLTKEQVEKVRGGGWDLETLQGVVDQFVIHYDAAGTSCNCFKILHDTRNLSVHFLLDLDGTIYQTLDLKERARHATVCNNRSVGIEIANPGAFGEREKDPFNDWYQTDARGHTVITIPQRFGANPQRTPDFKGRPARNEMIAADLQGKRLRQYDFTPQQYAALIKLTATLCSVFPKIKCDYPRDDSGHLATHALTPAQLSEFHGILGHFHIQTNKVDPGPAFQWDYVVNKAKRELGIPPAAKDGGKTGR